MHYDLSTKYSTSKLLKIILRYGFSLRYYSAIHPKIRSYLAVLLGKQLVHQRNPIFNPFVLKNNFLNFLRRK